MVWDTVQNFSIPHIVVDEAAFASNDPWWIVDSIAGFAIAAADFGGVSSREMPPEVLWSSQLTFYQSQVGLNGHFDFVCNSRWRGGNVEACRNGIAACGADDYLQVFDELVALVSDSGIPGEVWNERSAELLALPSMKDRASHLDSRYFALGEERLLTARIAWLRSLPNLRAVPAAQIRPIVEEMTTSNPLRSQRLAILEQERAASRKDDAREQNTRLFIDDAVLAMGERMLAELRRPFSDHPERLAPVYEIMAGQGIAWPVDPDYEKVAFLMLMPTTGKAALIIDFEPVCKPKAMPAELLAFALEEFEKAVPY